MQNYIVRASHDALHPRFLATYVEEVPVPRDILMGALLEATSAYNLKSDKLDRWRTMGQAFLRGVGNLEKKGKVAKIEEVIRSSPV